jgi:hypothetical protein
MHGILAPFQLPIRGITIAATAAIALCATGVSGASDHLDTPTVVANPSADIGDIYAWTAPDGRHLETDNRAQSHLPAIRFDDYLKVEGLTLALEQRERLHQVDRDGSENYSRHAKSIVQVGAPDAASQMQVTRPLGLPLEIIPEENPYARPQPAALPLRVPLWSNYAGAGDAIRFVRVGTLDDPDALPPDIHIFTSSKQPWVVLPEGIPAVPGYYDRKIYWPAESLERRNVLLGTRN